MADKLDALLFSIGEKADGEVPYTDALQKIKAKTELEHARRLKRARTIRILSVAASLVIVLGVGTVLMTSGFFRAGSAAPKAAAAYDEVAPEAIESQVVTSDAPTSITDKTIAGGEGGNAGVQASEAPAPAPMIACAPPQSEDSQTDTFSVQSYPDERALEPGEELIYLGVPTKIPTPTDLDTSNSCDRGYTIELLVDETAICELGEAIVYQLDEVSMKALWRISETDYLSILATDMSIDDLIDILQAMVD